MIFQFFISCISCCKLSDGTVLKSLGVVAEVYAGPGKCYNARILHMTLVTFASSATDRSKFSSSSSVVGSAVACDCSAMAVWCERFG